MSELIFVGTRAHKLHGNGKMSPSIVIPMFKDIGEQYGVKVNSFDSAQEYNSAASFHEGAVVVLVYNEESIQNPEYREEVLLSERAARDDGRASFIIHSSDAGLAIGNKQETYRALQAALVPMPRVARGEKASMEVFSNAALGSGADVLIRSPGETIDRSRYNVELIDTAHTFRGRPITSAFAPWPWEAT